MKRGIDKKTIRLGFHGWMDGWSVGWAFGGNITLGTDFDYNIGVIITGRNYDSGRVMVRNE